MGFIKRLLGIETRPGEPEPLSDESFTGAVEGSDMTAFVLFFSLWCPSCQVMHGLINEIGPDYIGRARFYKMDVGNSPKTVGSLGLRGVPVLAAFSTGRETDRITGLADITELRNWIESHLGGDSRGRSD